MPGRSIRRVCAFLLACAVPLAACGDDAALERLSSGTPADGSAPQPTNASKAAVRAVLATPFEQFAGGTTTLGAFAGRPVVVNFFASWCTPCITEMPDFEKVHQQLGDRVVFVGLDVQDRPKDGEDIVAKTKVTYNLGRDPDGKLFSAFGGLGMPTTVLLRPDGSVADTHTGAMRAADLTDKIRKELGIS